MPAIGPVQLIPPGLTGLLQLKQFGQVPGTLDLNVNPVIELRDWYMQARRVDEFALYGGFPATTVLTTGTGRGVYTFVPPGGGIASVPQNQTWYVEMLTVFTGTNTAGDVLSFAPGIGNNQGSSFQQVGPQYTDTSVARQRNCFANASRGFWAAPGDLFLLMVNDILTAGATFQLRLRATVLPI